MKVSSPRFGLGQMAARMVTAEERELSVEELEELVAGERQKNSELRQLKENGENDPTTQELERDLAFFRELNKAIVEGNLAKQRELSQLLYDDVLRLRRAVADGQATLQAIREEANYVNEACSEMLSQ
jgi:hypothetical protein